MAEIQANNNYFIIKHDTYLGFYDIDDITMQIFICKKLNYKEADSKKILLEYGYFEIKDNNCLFVDYKTEKVYNLPNLDF